MHFILFISYDLEADISGALFFEFLVDLKFWFYFLFNTIEILKCIYTYINLN